MTEVKNSKQYDLEERTLRFAKYEDLRLYSRENKMINPKSENLDNIK